MENKDDVGYKRPPKDSQFKKGFSGIPKGRPSGARNLRTDLQEELEESILVREGENSIRISKQRALVKTLIARMLKGDSRAGTTLTNMIYRLVDLRDPEKPVDEPLTADESEVLEVLKNRLNEIGAENHSADTLGASVIGSSAGDAQDTANDYPKLNHGDSEGTKS